MNSPLSARHPRTLPWVAFLLAAAIVFGLRFHTVNQVVVDWDESVYLVVAQDFIHGGSLYVTAWDHKGPLLYLTLAPVVAAANGNIEPVRLFTTAWLLASMWLVFLIARRLVPPERAFIAPLVYGIFFSLPRFGGLAANAELFMMLPAAASVWAAVRWIDERRGPAILALSGLLAGTAILYKPNAAFTVAVIPLMIFSRRYGGGNDRPRNAVLNLALFAAAAAVLPAIALAAFSLAGSVRAFLGAVFLFNRAYVAGTPFSEAWPQLAGFFGWALVGDGLTMLAVVSGVFLLVRGRTSLAQPWQWVLLGGLLVTSLAGVCLGRNLFFHYYLQMALPISLIVAAGAGALRITRTDWKRLAIIALLLGLASAFSPHRSDAGRRSRTPDEDRVLLEVAAYLDEHGQPSDEIFVLGGDPVIYYLADRKAPTKYFFWLFHAPRWDAILGSTTTTLESFRITPPEWFVYRRSSPRIPELERFMYANYEKVAEVGDYEIARWAR
jgi:4-amino-4-deoxy-L-arabinose transferase-like glycosyltransferase